MAKPNGMWMLPLCLVLVTGVVGYFVGHRSSLPTVVGVVRATEVRIAPEVGGQLAAINVKNGTHVHVGDVVAKLSAIELNASVAQARAALAAATAMRDHVYAGVRAEEIASLSAEIAKAKSRAGYAEIQLARTAELASTDTASKQALDEAENAVATARADIVEAEANHAAAVAGPTAEERLIAEAQVKAAASTLAVLERRLDKTVLKAPASGVVSVVVAEVGENVRPGQPVLVIQETGKRWLSFNVREDRLKGITVGSKVDITSPDAKSATTSAVVTELVPLGPFATWQAERAVGDHDRNTLRLRFEPERNIGLEPGATVWLGR